MIKDNYKFTIINLLLVTTCLGTVDISGATDSRLETADFDNYNYMLHGAEIDIKYTYADERGDRLITFVQIPYSPHYKTDMFLYHYGDAYLIVKGSLEHPNIKIGRFDIPFGLLKTFDPHFSLMPQIFERSLGIKKDIGAEVFGYYKMLTYDISFTQGYNSFENPRNDMPITLRLGLDNELIKCGISYYNSTHSMGDMPKMKKVGVDIEKNINPFIIRGEGIIGENPNGKGFSLIVDFPFFLGMQGSGSSLFWKEEISYQTYGLELKKDISFLTIGAGLVTEKESDAKTKAIFQTIIKL